MIPYLDTWKVTAKRGLWAYKGIKSVFALFTAFRRLGKSTRKKHAISPEVYRAKQNRNHKKHFSGWTVWVCFWFCKFAWTVKKRYF